MIGIIELLFAGKTIRDHIYVDIHHILHMLLPVPCLGICRPAHFQKGAKKKNKRRKDITK
jgi:hypothetical protein